MLCVCSSAVLRVRERESRREGRGGDPEHAAVRFHHTTGFTGKGDAEHRTGQKQQDRQVDGGDD